MPNRARQPEDDNALNLAPIMNIVVILIPLLLLSVVFLSVGIINVSAPQLLPSTSEAEPSESLDLTVAISAKGFSVHTSQGPVTPIQPCTTPGVTVCLEQGDAEMARRFQEIRRRDSAGEQEILDAALGAYDFAGLYETVRNVKRENEHETKVQITAEPDVPYALVVRVMDALRFEVEGTSFEDSSQFWAAKRKAQAGRPKPLFPDPVIAVMQ